MEPDLILDDLEISMDEEALALLEEKSMEVDSLLGTSLANGGVCKQVAVDMESLREPDAVRRVSLASYTDDWSRTNYTVTVEELQDMSQGAKVAIAVGVGLLVAKMVHWIIKSFFGGDDDSDGGGGGGGGKKQEKRLKALRETNQKISNATADMIRDFEKQDAEFRTAVRDAFTQLGVTPAAPRTSLQQAIDATIKPIIAPHFSAYIKECYDNPALVKGRIEMIGKDIASLTSNLYHMYGSLEGRLSGAVLNPDEYKIKYAFVYPGFPKLDSATAAAHVLNEVKASCTADPKLTLPVAEKLLVVEIPFLAFDDVMSAEAEEAAKGWLKQSDELTAKFKTLQEENLDKQVAALAHLKEGAQTLINLWRMVKPYRDNAVAYLQALDRADKAVLELLHKSASRMAKDSKKDEEKAVWKAWIQALTALLKELKASSK